MDKIKIHQSEVFDVKCIKFAYKRLDIDIYKD